MENNNNFDQILEMNTEAERHRIAIIAMKELLALETNYYMQSKEPEYIAKLAVEYADALIMELNKKKD